MHANTNSIKFDFEEAEKFHAALRTCKTTLENQARDRNEVTEYAKSQLEGGYGRLFSRNADSLIEMGAELIESLRNAEDNMKKYIAAAHEEVRIRKEVTEWESMKESLDNMNHNLRANHGALKPVKPEHRHLNPTDPMPPKPEPQPRPHYEVYNSNSIKKFNEKVDYTRANLKVGTSFPTCGGEGPATEKYISQQINEDDINMNELAQGKVSGIPEHLIKYYNMIKSMNPRVEQDYNAMKSSYEAFRHGTDWGEFNAESLIAAVYVWSQDNLVEAYRAGKIGEELWKAGSQGEISETNPNLSDPRVLHSVESSIFVNDQDLKKLPTKHMLPYVPSAGISGAYPSSGYLNDPVNIATGNFIEYELDLAFDNTAATALSLERMYNSFAVVHPEAIPSGIFGLGWCSTLDTWIDFTSENAQWYTKDGRILHFSRSGDGYDRTPQEPWWLTKVLPSDELYEWITQAMQQAFEQVHNCEKELAQNSHEEVDFSQKRGELTFTSHYWVIEDNKHTRHIYNSAGVWVGTAVGHLSDAMVPVYATATFEFESVPQRIVTDLVHPVAHRAIHIDYELDSTGGLHPAQAYTYNTAGISAGTPQTAVGYSYVPEGENASGHLCAAEKMNGTRTYTHTPEHLIHEVADVNGHVEVTNTYDDNGRVIHQHTEYDDDISYSYTDAGVTTVAQAETGLRVNIFYSDPKGRLTGVTDGNGKRYSIRYGTGDNRVSITDRDGSITSRSFDQHDRLVRERTPEGTDYTYSWDEYNRVTGVSVCDARDVRNLGTPVTTFYEYADSVNPNPSAVIESNGAKTQLVWDEHGRLVETIDPTGVCTVMTYDIHGDLKTMTDGVGNTTTLVRDGAGRVTQVIDPLGRTLRIRYNASGMISSFEEATGARWSFLYQEAREAPRVPATLRTAQRFAGLDNTDIVGDQEQGNLPHAVTDPYGNVTTLTYNRAREITSVTDPLGRTTQNIYNQSGNLTQVIEASGATWTYEYDGIRQLIAAIDPLGGVTRYTYDPVGNRTSETDPTGVKIKQNVDRKRGLERTTDAYGNSFKQIDVFGRVVAQKTGVKVGSSEKPDSEEFITYDHAGNPVEIVDAQGGLTRIIRDLAGRPLRVVSPAGRVQTYEYDAAGRLERYAMSLDEPVPAAEITQDSEPTQWAVTRLVYDAASQVVERILPDGSAEYIDYDAAGRVIKVTKGARSASYEYDQGGRLVGLRDNTYGYRRFSYDAAGQLIRTIDGLGNRTHMKYDAAGNIAQVMDSTGQITRYEYDALNRLTRTINAAGNVFEYGYDAAGRLTRAFDGVHERTYEYDYKRGGELRYAFCDGVRIAQYGSENKGRTVWVRDYATAQALDNRAPKEAYVEHRYEYDSAGQLVKRSRSAVIDPHSPDSEHKMSKSTDVENQVQALNTFVSTGAYTLTYSYDADGNRTATVTPYGTSHVVYDGAGHVVRRETYSTGEDKPVVSTYSYDVMGQLVRAQVGDIVSTWRFDASGRVSEYGKNLVAEEASDVAGGIEAENQGINEKTQITRDAQGRVAGVQTNNSLVMYSYDAAGQLIGAREGDLEYEWVFENGLMVSEKLYRVDDAEQYKRTVLSERSFEYNVLNQLVQIETLEYAAAIAPEFVGLHHEVINRVTTTYTYDAAGYRVREYTASNQGTRTAREYEWGVWGGLSSVTTTSNSDAFHTEALGVRGVASRVRLVTDATGELAQVTGVDSISMPVLWDSLSDTPQVLGVGAVSAPDCDGGFSQVGVPQGLNPWGVPDPAGIAHIPGIRSFDPFSQVLPEGVSFTGAGSVRIAGLDVMGARTFDGVSKRFLSTDPLAPVAGSPWFADPYSFVGSSPMNMVDPWGTTEVSVALAQDTSFEGWLSRNRQEVSHALIAVGIVVSVVSIPIPGLSVAIAAGTVSGSSMAAGITLNSNASLKSGGYVDTGDVAFAATVGGITGGLTAAAGYGAAYGVQKWVAPKAVEGFSKVRSTFSPSTSSAIQTSERAIAAETRFVPQGSNLVNSSSNAARVANVESKVTSASPTAVKWENVPVVAAGTKGASTGVRSGIPTRTVTVSASQGKAVPLVATGSKGASSLKAAGPAQVGKVPGAPAAAVASKGTQIGSKSASGELRAVGPVNVGKSSSGTAKPTVGQRLKAVGANAAVNGATGAAVNGVSYTGQSLMGLTPEPFNTGELFTQMGTGATGNILGGLAKPAAGSVGNYLGFKPGGFGQNSLEAGFAGGMSMANGELWAGLSGNPTSGGDKVYNFASGAGLSQVGNFGPKNHKLGNVKVGPLGQPLKGPEYLGSYRQMGLEHPALLTSHSGRKPLFINSTTNAGLVAVSDGAKKYWVDRLLNFEGAPVDPVPSPGPSPAPLSVDSDGSGMSGGEVQVLEPEDVREPGDVQAPEDIRGSENVQGPEYVYPAEGAYAPADMQPDEDVDPVEGSDVDFVGGE